MTEYTIKLDCADLIQLEEIVENECVRLYAEKLKEKPRAAARLEGAEGIYKAIKNADGE